MIFNLNGEWPRIGMVCLEEDTAPSGATGQSESPSVEEVSAIMSEAGEATAEPATETPQESYFHSITIPGETEGEDEVLNFKDAKELSDSYMRNRFRRSDYTKKTQSLAEQRKEYERQQAALLEKETMLTRTSNQFNEYDSLLKTLTPEQFNKFVDQVKGVTKTQNPELKALQEKMSALENEKKEQARATALQKKKEDQRGRFESKGRYLKSQYEDYNHEDIMKAYEELNNVSSEEAEQKVLEFLYYASKGRGSSTPPADPAGPVRTRVSSTSAGAPTKAMSLDEAKAAALAEFG